MRRTALLSLAALALAACAQSAPPPPAPQSEPADALKAREVYELSERCGRTARDWFKDNWGDGESRSDGIASHSSYENHYNPKLNRCFALLNMMFEGKNSKTGAETLRTFAQLYDVNDAHAMGSYLVNHEPNQLLNCLMGKQQCTSTDQWDAWAATYLER